MSLTCAGGLTEYFLTDQSPCTQQHLGVSSPSQWAWMQFCCSGLLAGMPGENPGHRGEEGGLDWFVLTEKNELIREFFFFLTINVRCNLLLYER